MRNRRFWLALATALLILLCVSSATAADRTTSVKRDALGSAVSRGVCDVDLGQAGWVRLDGETYYGDEDGTAVTGLRRIGGEYYFFDEEGRLQTGWVKIRDKMWEYAGQQRLGEQQSCHN